MPEKPGKNPLTAELLFWSMPSDNTFDLVSIGECLVELSREQDGRFRAAWAGDAVNTLFYASRLGLRSGFLTTFGDDLFTPVLREGIAAEGIDLSYSTISTGHGNGLYAIELDETGEYTFHFWRENSAARETLIRVGSENLRDYCSQADWLLISGVTLAVMKERERLIRLLQRLKGSGTMVALDSNFRPALWNSTEEYCSLIAGISPLVDLFLPSQSDLERAWPGMQPSDVLDKLNVARIAMKCGPDPCLLRWDGRESLIPPPVVIRPVDTTGAGDAFNAGVLSGLIRGRTPAESVLAGHQVAAEVLKIRGALDHDFRRQTH